MGFASLVDWSLRHRAAVIGTALLLVALGTWQSLHLRLDVLPELTRPTVSVHFEAPALSAEDASSLIALPAERSLMGLPGLVRLRSSAVAGLALLQAEFAWDSDAYRVRQLVAERLDAVRAQLPPGVDPRLGPPTSLMGEILLVGLHAADRAALAALRSHADFTLRPQLLGTPGVAQVTVIGGQVAQWEVQPDPARLRLFDLRLERIIEALRGYGESRGGGLAAVEGREQTLRIAAAPFDAEALKRTAVDLRAAGPVWLGQVADVVPGARTARGAAGADAEPAVILAISRQADVDTLALTRELEARLEQLDAQLPAGARRSLLFRQADYIGSAIANVRDALLHGTLIVALVLALFLRGGRANLVSLVAIPVSMAGAILLLAQLGLTLNTLTLGGLAIAVGELVDDAVVGVENVARRLREAGAGTLELVARATVEVRSGILQATLVIVAGFLPLFALGGVEGRLFASLGIAYVAAILVSLLVAATLTPVLCALGFLGKAEHLPHERRWLQALRARYLKVLAQVIDRGALLAGLAAALLLLALAALASLPRSFLPTLNENTLTVNLVLTPGLALEESDRVGRAAEALILQVPGVRGTGRRTGRAELDEHAEGPHYSEIDVRLDPARRARDAIAADIATRLSVLPGSVSIGQPISHRIDHLLAGVRAPLAVKLFGEDVVQLEALAAQVRDALQATPGLVEARLDDSGRTRELRVRVDEARAALHGLSPARVADVVGGLSAGLPLSRLMQPPAQTDLVLRLAPEVRDPRRLSELPIDAPAGAVPLGWIAELEHASVPDRVVREDGRRRLLLSAFAAPGADLDSAANALGQRLAALQLPPGFEIRVEGQSAQARRAGVQLALLSLLALAAMSALLYARFRSWVCAAIVLAGVPLAWSGGAFALVLTGTPLSLASLIGFVTLAGIAARNSILKIALYIDIAASSKGDLREQVLQGSGERLAPVLMTSLVAAFSLVPLLLGADVPGREILHPVALVVFGGLLSSTLLDSFVTPALYRRFAPASAPATPAA